MVPSAPLAGKHHSPACVAVVAHPCPGPAFCSAKNCVFVPSKATVTARMAFSLPVCVAPTRPVHSRAASETVLAGIQRVAANIEGSRYF